MTKAEMEKVFKDRWFWLALAVAGFFLSLTLWFGFTMDQAICNYVAWVWKQYSQPPYIGAWDLSFPGIFLVHRFVLAVFGRSMFGFRLFDFIVQLGSLAMIFYLSRRLSKSSVAGFFSSVAWGIYYFSLGPLESGEREGFVLFIMLAALIIGLNLKERYWLRALLAGLLIGFAFQLKPTYGLACPIFAVWFLAEGFSLRPGMVWAEVLLLIMACLVPTLGFILYYWHLGHLQDLYNATFYFNYKVYSGTALAGSVGTSPWHALQHSFILRHPVLIFFALLGILTQINKGQRSIYGMLLVLAMMSFASYLIQAKYFAYHLIPFYGMAAVFSGAGMAAAGSVLKKARNFSGMLQAIFCGLVFLLMIATVQPWLVDYAVKFAYRNPAKVYSTGNSYDAFYYRAAKQLKPIIGDSEMEYFGWNPLIPYILQKKLPSRFCVVYHLLMRQRNGRITAMQEGWIREYTDSVISARPKFFLVSDQVPGWDVFNLPTPSLKQAMHDYFPELENFLLQNYARKENIGEIEVYELK